LLGIALAVVQNDGALPTAFLVGIEFAQIRHHALAWPRVGANALDEGKVGMDFAILGPTIASEKHRSLLGSSMAEKAGENQWGRFPRQRQKRVSTTENSRDLQEIRSKIVCFCAN